MVWIEYNCSSDTDSRLHPESESWQFTNWHLMAGYIFSRAKTHRFLFSFRIVTRFFTCLTIGRNLLITWPISNQLPYIRTIYVYNFSRYVKNKKKWFNMTMFLFGNLHNTCNYCKCEGLLEVYVLHPFNIRVHIRNYDQKYMYHIFSYHFVFKFHSFKHNITYWQIWTFGFSTQILRTHYRHKYHHCRIFRFSLNTPFIV